MIQNYTRKFAIKEITRQDCLMKKRKRKKTMNRIDENRFLQKLGELEGFIIERNIEEIRMKYLKGERAIMTCSELIGRYSVRIREIRQELLNMFKEVTND
jgi:hypothetical protein